MNIFWSEVAQSCPTLCDPVDCSPPGSPIHGISQARILEWVAISFSRGSSWSRNWTHCLLHCQVDSLPLSHLRNLFVRAWEICIHYIISSLNSSGIYFKDLIHRSFPFFPFWLYGKINQSRKVSITYLSNVKKKLKITSTFSLSWKLSDKELMSLNCGVGEDSWESLGQQGDPTDRKSVV